jgi:hypothetical protein
LWRWRWQDRSFRCRSVDPAPPLRSRAMESPLARSRTSVSLINMPSNGGGVEVLGETQLGMMSWYLSARALPIGHDNSQQACTKSGREEPQRDRVWLCGRPPDTCEDECVPLPLRSNLMRAVRRTHVHLGSAIAAKKPFGTGNHGSIFDRGDAWIGRHAAITRVAPPLSSQDMKASEAIPNVGPSVRWRRRQDRPSRIA